MPGKPLRIAWVGPGPGEGGGVGGVTTELLAGLAKFDHKIDCFLPGRERPLPSLLGRAANVTFIWGTSGWQWNRWYSRTKLAAFASGLLARSIASLRLRHEITRRHREQPYDLIYQFSNIEGLAVPSGVARAVPLVIHPETHIAGELRFLISERRLSWRCEPRYKFAVVAAIMFIRARVQRTRIRRAGLLICISGVFRDHLVRDYGYPLAQTVVAPNPVRTERFGRVDDELAEPPCILVLGRVAVRKGIEDMVAVAQTLHDQEVKARVRVVGGPSQWSDYTPLLEDLPSETAEYAGQVSAVDVQAELARTDILLQASKYEPFALTVAEALAAGVPVVATSEVGAVESVDRSVVTVVEPGDVAGMAAAIIAMLDTIRASPTPTRSLARAEAERLFAPEIVCEQISTALERLIERSAGPPA
jgi:glycosyltransferase involved in cell wall biosynthesis